MGKIYGYARISRPIQNIERQIRNILELYPNAHIVKEVYTGVCSHYDELAEDISKNSQGFAFERLFNVDKALLILAIYEIKYMASIPFKVSVDEALNLAEKYSTEKSCKYINGILSKFSK